MRHQEIELALVQLYRLTGERKHLDLAAYFINQRGRQPNYFDEQARRCGEDPKDFWAKSYNQSHKPVREQTKVVAMRCRRCTCIPRWRISPPSSRTTA